MKTVLASASPRRKQILENAGFEVEIRVSEADETLPEGISPEKAVEYLASVKAHAVKREKDELVIAADTVVALDGKILGKPRDEKEAFEMLSLLSGKKHTVYTGVCLLYNEKEEIFSDSTGVEFYPLTDGEILKYIETGEPMDKAGAYGIQGKGCVFVKGIKGDYFNVMGLPVSKLNQKLKNFD
jgi:septum formation protein